MSIRDFSTPPVVLVTGATGFIGRNLCVRLLAEGYRVRGAFRSAIPIVNELADVEWMRVADVGPDTDWTEALGDVQYVVHLAALAHQIGKRGEGRLEEFMCVNAKGTRRLAEQSASVHTLRRLIYISSIGAVCSLSADRITEATPCRPDTDYGRSKLAGESAIQETLSQERDWCIFRPTLVYGPGNPGNMARLLRLIQTGLPLPLASVNNRRSFIFVENLVDAIVKALSQSSASRRIFLLSDGQDVSTPELIRILAEQAGYPARLVPCPVSLLQVTARVGDSIESLLGVSTGMDTYSIGRLVGSLTVDSTAITQEIGWLPPFTLTQGLQRTFREVKGRDNTRWAC